MKYHKKPIAVDAFQFGVDEAPEWFLHIHVYYVPVSGEKHQLECIIPTIEGAMRAHEGNMIIKGIEGEIYPCKKDIFDKCYEPVEEEITDELRGYSSYNIRSTL